jgi:ATP-dependent DNA ligase
MFSQRGAQSKTPRSLFSAPREHWPRLTAYGPPYRRDLMPHQLLPSAAVPAALPLSVRPKIISAASEPPHGDDWLHEVKHDGHRLIAIVARPGSTKLPSRNAGRR